MNAFDAGRGVEAKANAILLPYLREQSDGALVITNKGTLARWLQESVGDVLMNVEEKLFAVELKSEHTHTGNVFLEIWSNRNLECRQEHARYGQNTGWLMKLKADLLLYYFLDKDILYSFDVFSLKRWMFGCGDALGAWGSGKYKERCQRKYSQANDTWGVLVPVATLFEELPHGAMKQTRIVQRSLEVA